MSPQKRAKGDWFPATVIHSSHALRLLPSQDIQPQSRSSVLLDEVLLHAHLFSTQPCATVRSPDEGCKPRSGLGMAHPRTSERCFRKSGGRTWYCSASRESRRHLEISKMTELTIFVSDLRVGQCRASFRCGEIASKVAYSRNGAICEHAKQRAASDSQRVRPMWTALAGGLRGRAESVTRRPASAGAQRACRDGVYMALYTESKAGTSRLAIAEAGSVEPARSLRVGARTARMAPVRSRGQSPVLLSPDIADSEDVLLMMLEAQSTR